MKIVYSDFHINHSPKLYFAMGKMSEYPEKISRMQSILDALQHIPHELKNPVDHDMAPILAVHSKQYVEYLQTAYETWIENHGDPNGVIPDTFACRIDQIYNDIGLKSPNVFSKHGMFLFDTAAVIAEKTYQAAYEAVQVGLTAADLILQGNRNAFALTRPPGHHSMDQMGGGFCFLNNAAIAAQYIIDQSKKRVCILDVDYHHGNGTQCIFYRKSNPLFVSLHGQDDYPFYWGNEIETGQGPGLGYNVNVPLPVGTKDEEYLAALDKTIKEHILPYGADYLVVSLGVDTYSGDPVGMFDISQDCFYKIGQLIQSIGLPCLILMEGGYDIQELGTNVVNFLKAFH